MTLMLLRRSKPKLRVTGVDQYCKICEIKKLFYTERIKQNMYYISMIKKNYGQEVPSAAAQDPVADCPEEREVPSLKEQTKTLLVSLDQS